MVKTMKRIYAVVPVYNRKNITLNFLKKIKSISNNSFILNIVVVDDASTDGTFEAISENYPDVTILKGNGNLWWTGGTNLGVKYALKQKSDYVLTINDDVEFEKNFLEEMVNTSNKFPGNIICGLICHDEQRDVVLSAGRYRAGFLGYKSPAKYQGCKASEIKDRYIESELESGYSMLIPKKVFDLAGLFDDRHFPHHMGDMDFVLRARKYNVKVIVDTHARLYTETGDNYISNFIVNENVKDILKNLFDIKSTIYWKTRCRYSFRHSIPRFLGVVAISHYLLRMIALLAIKGFFPKKIIMDIANRRYG
jgi:GT2 family glycosyltransferase